MPWLSLPASWAGPVFTVGEVQFLAGSSSAPYSSLPCLPSSTRSFLFFQGGKCTRLMETSPLAGQADAALQAAASRGRQAASRV